MQKIKHTIFGIVALTLGIVLFVVLDFTLAFVSGQIHKNQLFTYNDSENSAYASHKYINTLVWQSHFNSFTPAVDYKPFSQKKPLNEYRIVVIGGSSVAGFPYTFYNSFPAYLQQNVQLSNPERVVRVYNLGATALASGTIASHIAEVDALKPDAVIIYMGHNEFYGANALLSQPEFLRAFPQTSRFLSYLDHSFFYQLLKKGINSLRHSRTSNSTETVEMTQMERRVLEVGNYQIATDSTYVIDQYLSNLEVIVDHLNNSTKATIWVTTLLSNKKDQPPLSRDNEAISAFQNAVKLDSTQADKMIVYEAYQQALNLDKSPFRALGYFNNRLRSWASIKENTVRLVDLEKQLQISSFGPLPGFQFFSDHLHFNDLGNKWVAKELSVVINQELKKWSTTSITTNHFSLVDSLKLNRTDLLDKSSASLQLQSLANIGQIGVSVRLEKNYSDSVDVIALGMLTQSITFDEAYKQSMKYYSSLDNRAEYNLGLRPFVYWEFPQNSQKWDSQLNTLWINQKNAAIESLIWPMVDSYSNFPTATQATNIGISSISMGNEDLGVRWLKTALNLDASYSKALISLSQYYLIKKDTLQSNVYFIRYQQSL